MKYDYRYIRIIQYGVCDFFLSRLGVQFGLFGCNYIKTQILFYFVPIFVFQGDVAWTIYESFGDISCRKIIININNIVNVQRSHSIIYLPNVTHDTYVHVIAQQVLTKYYKFL